MVEDTRRLLRGSGASQPLGPVLVKSAREYPQPRIGPPPANVSKTPRLKEQAVRPEANPGAASAGASAGPTPPTSAAPADGAVRSPAKRDRRAAAAASAAGADREGAQTGEGNPGPVEQSRGPEGHVGKLEIMHRQSASDPVLSVPPRKGAMTREKSHEALDRVQALWIEEDVVPRKAIAPRQYAGGTARPHVAVVHPGDAVGGASPVDSLLAQERVRDLSRKVAALETERAAAQQHASEAQASYEALEARFEAMRQQFDDLRQTKSIADQTSSLLETAMKDRQPLTWLLDSAIPLAVRGMGAVCGLVRTFDDQLKLSDYSHYEDDSFKLPLAYEAIVNEVYQNDEFFWTWDEVPGTVIVAQRLDVGGETFGAAIFAFRGQMMNKKAIAGHCVHMHAWCNVVDKYLASVAAMRKKHALSKTISDALKDPVLDDGLSEAMQIVSQQVEFDDLLLVFSFESDEETKSLYYKVIRRGKLVHDSRRMGVDDETHCLIAGAVETISQGPSTALRAELGLASGAVEEVSIGSAAAGGKLGCLVVARTAAHDFTVFDREIVDQFADYITQRIVNFSSEWRRLTAFFSADTTRRLLKEANYHQKYLTPRQVDVAILYSDICSFTKLSEQILVDAQKVALLIDIWSKGVVDIIWDTNGVLDKLVGDCVIAFWGPPFYDESPRTSCMWALEAARRISAFTLTLCDHPELPELRGVKTAVSTGLNFTQACLGIIGPNNDLTCFSSGMNNTARLQGQAAHSEILCMTDFCDVLGKPSLFGEIDEFQAKNVKDPLKFRRVLQP